MPSKRESLLLLLTALLSTVVQIQAAVLRGQPVPRVLTDRLNNTVAATNDTLAETPEIVEPVADTSAELRFSQRKKSTRAPTGAATLQPTERGENFWDFSNIVAQQVQIDYKKMPSASHMIHTNMRAQVPAALREIGFPVERSWYYLDQDPSPLGIQLDMGRVGPDLHYSMDSLAVLGFLNKQVTPQQQAASPVLQAAHQIALNFMSPQNKVLEPNINAVQNLLSIYYLAHDAQGGFKPEFIALINQLGKSSDVKDKNIATLLVTFMQLPTVQVLARNNNWAQLARPNNNNPTFAKLVYEMWQATVQVEKLNAAYHIGRRRLSI